MMDDYTSYKIPASVLGFCILLSYPTLLLCLVFLSFGAFASYLYFAPDQIDLFGDRNASGITAKWEDLSDTKKSGGDIEEDVAPANDVISFPEPLQKNVQSLVDYIIRDFIDFWHQPLNTTSSNEFTQNLTHSLLSVASKFATKLKRHDGHVINSSILLAYGLSNSVIIHIREYKTFESSISRQLRRYIIENPSSELSSYFDQKQRSKRLRKLASFVSGSLLPAKDKDSKVVTSLVTDILVSCVLEPVLGLLSNPDFINRLLVETLAEDTVKSAETTELDVSSFSIAVYAIRDFSKQSAKKEFSCFIVNGDERFEFPLSSPNKRSETTDFAEVKWERPRFLTLSPSSSVEVAIELFRRGQETSETPLRIGEVRIPIDESTKGWVDIQLANEKYRILLEVRLFSRSNDIKIGTQPEIQQIVELEGQQMETTVPLTPSSSNVSKSEDDSSIPDLFEDIMTDHHLYSSLERYLESNNHPNYLSPLTAILSYERIAEVYSANANSSQLSDNKASLQRDAFQICNEFLSSANPSLKFPEILFNEINEKIVCIGDGKNAQDVFHVAKVWMKGQIETILDIWWAQYESAKKIDDRSLHAVAVDWEEGTISPTRLDAETLGQSTFSLDDADSTATDEIQNTETLSEYTSKRNSTDDIALDISLISSSIVKLRNQIDELSQELASLPDTDSQKRSDIIGTQTELQYQIQKLEELASQMIDGSASNTELKESSRRFGLEDLDLDIDITSSDDVFIIQVMSRNSKSGGWILTKSHSDFKEIHSNLCKLFPKVSKVPFPKPLRSSELKLWLSLLLSDSEIRKSNDLVAFLDPSIVSSNLDKSNTISLPNLKVAQTMKGVMKSAGGMFKDGIKELGGVLSTSTSSGSISTTYKRVEGDKPEHGLADDRDVIESIDKAENNDVEEKSSSRCSSDHPIELNGQQSTKASSNISFDEHVTSVSNSNIGSDQSPAKSDSVPMKSRRKVEQDITQTEIDLLIESIFAIIAEIFSLAPSPSVASSSVGTQTAPNWLRRKLLALTKDLLKPSLSTMIQDLYKQHLPSLSNSSTYASLINALNESLWPGGARFGTIPPPKALSVAEQRKLREEAARKLKKLVPDGVRTLLGKSNTEKSLTSLFEMCQVQELNEGLILSALEGLIKVVLAGD
ncbi:PXA domain-containing protein [Paraphysoderma sedebokerense]|nr:PXA domain-containing protein [Paraphysoderma sedebokerense]